ncbi:MAG TPA: hypothetical protein VJN67_05640 [Stellaceae bacterium]|nr:hypothetical protein [Stellaceae bacterium]
MNTRAAMRTTWAMRSSVGAVPKPNRIGFSKTQHFQGNSHAAQMALQQLFQMTHQQGEVVAFADVLLVLTAIFVALAGLALLMHKPTTAGGASGEH